MYVPTGQYADDVSIILRKVKMMSLYMPFRTEEKDGKQVWKPFSVKEMKLFIPKDKEEEFYNSWNKDWTIELPFLEKDVEYPLFAADCVYDQSIKIMDNSISMFFSDSKTSTAIFYDIYNSLRENGEFDITNEGVVEWVNYLCNGDYMLHNTKFVYSAYGMMQDDIIIRNEQSPHYDPIMIVMMETAKLQRNAQHVLSCKQMLKNLGAKNPEMLFQSLANLKIDA